MSESVGDIYATHAEVCAVFSNPARLELLDLLGKGEKSVGELTKLSGLSQANVSQHLAIMRYKGVVLARKKGKNVYYRLADSRIIKAFKIIRRVIAERMKRFKR
ncbi:MAG TPA: metalloregulator ArsR/SmtB family transcription factor [Candidatus Norongarragalinales archaeon]|nr:metalloregulator ArsR/SmtB family transcription factor [Candidatus Norongarragalinales archaeon]